MAMVTIEINCFLQACLAWWTRNECVLIVHVYQMNCGETVADLLCILFLNNTYIICYALNEHLHWKPTSIFHPALGATAAGYEDWIGTIGCHFNGKGHHGSIHGTNALQRSREKVGMDSKSDQSSDAGDSL